MKVSYNENNLVSVIMPCYNQGKFIDDAIQSVLDSSYPNIEIIVINDGSTDKYTNEILKNNKWANTVIYTIENKGVSNARNFGINVSNGKYILPIDADDKISSDYIDQAVNVLENNQDVKVVTCNVELFGSKKGRYILPDFSLEMLMGQNIMVVSSMFRRSDFENTTGFNPNMALGFEDWDFWLSLLENGGDVFKLDCIGFFYRIKKKSRNNIINNDNYIALRKQIFLNHRKLYLSYFFNPLYSFEYSLLYNSKEYRIGKFVLSLFRLLKK
jgi:glycosyltransferase involved in cell wall biosynthesis